MDPDSLLKAVMGSVRSFKFDWHFVDGCLMDNHAISPIFKKVNWLIDCLLFNVLCIFKTEISQLLINQSRGVVDVWPEIFLVKGCEILNGLGRCMAGNLAFATGHKRIRIRSCCKEILNVLIESMAFLWTRDRLFYVTSKESIHRIQPMDKSLTTSPPKNLYITSNQWTRV